MLINHVRFAVPAPEPYPKRYPFTENNCKTEEGEYIVGLNLLIIKYFDLVEVPESFALLLHQRGTPP